MTTDDIAPHALVVRAAAGERVEAGGVEHVFALTGTQTEGRSAVERFVLPAGALGARPHVHHAHDECFVVLAGELTVAAQGGETVLHAGDLAYAPRGSLHGFRNATAEDVTALCLYTPAGYEQYFRDVHSAVEHGRELTEDLLRGLRARHATDTPA